MINFEKYRNMDGSINLVDAYEDQVSIGQPEAYEFLNNVMRLYPIQSNQIQASCGNRNRHCDEYDR